MNSWATEMTVNKDDFIHCQTLSTIKLSMFGLIQHLNNFY